ncbi:Isy1-like splicing family-domain-containing protein [Dunaliella salina]|uniref:Isy1-like splicing family-domain-containing protein n=1 Tax=Dunaliella salina TaxID=3046 RepID=A0ABQ7GRF1_DUNSA|nr:Isy1-like splicing family-domain-containing protein [Dunaliella salina]|eukprot:KAF5837178.1 Isy1-like splicing family-domain-containing protein [Dunaliella salina]
MSGRKHQAIKHARSRSTNGLGVCRLISKGLLRKPEQQEAIYKPLPVGQAAKKQGTKLAQHSGGLGSKESFQGPLPAVSSNWIRDLNDEINKLIREKGHWERRIVELGGPDYSKSAPKVADSRGREVAEMTGKGGGYRYFGAAKALPGVKELFEVEPPKQVRKTRYQMHKVGKPCMRASMHMNWCRCGDILVRVFQAASSAATSSMLGSSSSSSLLKGSGARFVAYVPLPDQKAIEQLVLEKKKADLLAKYTSESLVKEQEEAKSLLNIRFECKEENDEANSESHKVLRWASTQGLRAVLIADEGYGQHLVNRRNAGMKIQAKESFNLGYAK